QGLLKDERHIPEAATIDHKRGYAAQGRDADQDHGSAEDHVLSSAIVFEHILYAVHKKLLLGWSKGGESLQMGDLHDTKAAVIVANQTFAVDNTSHGGVDASP